MKPNFIRLPRANKAIQGVLLFAVCSILCVSNTYGQTVIKQLYLSDPSQALDRVDPVATADATLAQTAAITPTSQYLYALRGASRTDFWRFNIASNSWSAMASTPATVTRGASLASDGTYLYALRGGATDFWRYNPGTNAWSVMSTAPAGVTAGADLVFVGGAIYAFQGGSTTFWKYTISSNTWSILAAAPASIGWGGALTTNGADIFALRGGASNTFWKYTVANNTWSVLATLPANADFGASLSFDGTYVYALRGSASNNFYRYNISSNAWTSMANTTSTVGRGGSIVSDDPTSYALRGASNNNFWSFNGSAWSSLSSTPSNVDSGAAIIKFGTVGRTATFTQSPALCSNLIIKAGTITVTNYATVVYGTMPANPAITATMRYGTTNIITLSNPTYNSATGLITWTGTLAADATVPSGQAISLDITTTQQGVSFRIDYDSQNKPSKIEFPVSTFVNVSSLNVYFAAYANMTILNSVLGGTTRYVRASVTDPFGFADVTGVNFTITPTGAVTAGTAVASSGCTRVFEAPWNVPSGGSSYTISATAREGYENTVTHTKTITMNTCANCPPTANVDYATGNGGEPIEIDVLANDSDPNNNINPSSLSIDVEPKNGSVIIDNNKITYLPNGTFQGNDTLVYEICDNTLLFPLCDTAKVIITVLPIAFNTCSDATLPKTYYIPYAEDQALTALKRSASGTLPTNNIRTVISIKVSYPGMTLTWDHWEDGYESNILAPTQSTTQVWGDGNIYNGFAPGYPSDIIPVGGSIVLDNTMASSPRSASSIFYDGKDKLYSSGQVSVTQVCGEPATIAVQCMKTNVSAYPSDYGKSFTLPVGQNLPSRDFRYTALFIRAAENNTTVHIDRNNDGTFNNTFTLNEGQVIMVDANTAPPTPIYAGAVITSDKPIGVDAHFAGVDGWSSREVPLFPSTWYSNVYYTPVPTTGPGTTGVLDTAVVMLFNSLSRDININWSSGVPSSGTILLPANAAYRFAMPLSTTAAYKFENPTKESFVALEIVDSYTPGGGGNDGTNRDWAFNLISEARLTDFASVAWAPGSTDMTRNDNPIWVTPSTNTTVYVKYDGDILNGPNTSPCGMKYDVAIPVNTLNHIRIRDAADNNQSGTAVYTCNGAKIAAVYGEDPQTALIADPSWDVGSTIQPFCKEKLVIANDDYAVTLVNTPVTINVVRNDAGFLAIIDPATVTTTGLLQPSHGEIVIDGKGNIIYVPNSGYIGTDTFQYTVCSTPTPVVCATATVYISIGSCPSPAGKNILSGQVFLDKNADGVKNDGGTGFAPARLYLYVDGNCSNSININELVDSVDADANGYYQFVKAPEKIVADNFDLVGGGNSCANGSDGNTPWRSDWYDNNDPSSGFCKGVATADVEIIQDGAFGYALRIDNTNRSAIREFNMQNATQAFLSFSYRKATTTLQTGENIFVELSSDGSTYNVISTIAGNSTSNSSYIDVSNINIPVATYNGNNKTYLRIRTSSNTDDGDFVFFDNFSIKFLQYDQCYMVSINTAMLASNAYLTTASTKSFTFNNAGTCVNNMDFGIKRILTYTVNDENSTWQGIAVSGPVKVNDFDQEGNAQNFNSFLVPSVMTTLTSGTSITGISKTGAIVANAGNLVFDATGNYTFVPAAGFTGIVTIPYKVCDNGSPSACDTAYLAITVDPLPGSGSSIIANNDEDISYGTVISGNLFVNDRDPRYYAFTATLFSYDTNGDGTPDVTTMPGSVTVAGKDIYGKLVANAGTLSVSANGNYTFTPASGFAGSVDASYVITNTAGAVSTAIIHFDVLSDINGIQNDPPFAGDDFGYTTVNKPVTGSFIINDREPNSDTLSLSGTFIIPSSMANAIGSPVATAQGGTVQFYSNGTYTYTPPTGYIGPDIINYTICDAGFQIATPLCATGTLHLLVGPGISISGKVWDDGNGNIIPELGFENVTNAQGTLYVNLVDALGYVVATAAVANDGTYSFVDVAPGLSYSLVLSTINGIVNTPAPAASLPSDWTNTGETRNGTIDYGSVGVIDNRSYGFANAINMDFGIEQLPTSVPFYINIEQPTVGQVITLNGGSNPPVLSGKDPEDCNSGCELTTRNVVIDVVPNNSDLYYNGVLVTAGQLIINFNPDLLSITFTSATLGSKTTEFYYSFVDSAGKKDPVTALYSLNWLTLLPVKGLELTALKAGKNAVLNWKTITEMSSDHFEIERSVDGRNYVKVGSNVAAAGNSIGEKQYQVADDISGLNTPIVYYRVKLLDTRGKYAYSNVSAVKLPENGAVIKVVPNPFISEMTITVSVEQTTSFGIRMLDMSGRVISASSQKITREAPGVTLRNLNNLVRGMYIVEVTDAETGKKSVFKVEKAY